MTQKLNRQIVYIDKDEIEPIKLRVGQELVLANTHENFQRNYMIVRIPQGINDNFENRAIAGIFAYPEMERGTYVAALLVAQKPGAEGEITFSLGYAHVQKPIETKTIKYTIVGNKRRAPRKRS